MENRPETYDFGGGSRRLERLGILDDIFFFFKCSWIYLPIPIYFT